jgi:hypothetical protein
MATVFSGVAALAKLWKSHKAIAARDIVGTMCRATVKN